MSAGQRSESESEMWERELREAGWRPHTFRGHERKSMWVTPNGEMFRGPYGAWRMMQSLRQWACDSPFHPGCDKCEVKR